MSFNTAMVPVHFNDGILFFQEDDAGLLESDSWRISEKCEKTQILRNRKNHILIACPEDSNQHRAVFEPVTDQEIQNASGTKFTIHMYEDTNIPRGLPVAFTTEWKSKTYYMCVVKDGSNMRVEFKEGNVPRRIAGQSSNVIFNKIQFSEGDHQFFMFESALEKDCFLAFEWDENSKATKLIVKKMETTDEVDESLQIHHSSHSSKSL
uniref:Interleukin-18-like n=1 Tax=Pogona vitticeps TaxID=103695 RepID=A0ABM5EQJ1_9SAUR